jgi:hypothetical protein
VTTVHIAHAVPWPGARPDGGFMVSQYLIVLTEAAAEDAEDAGAAYSGAGRRALPLWLAVPGGDALWQLLNRPAKDPVMAGVLEGTAARLLDAAGVIVAAVDLRVTSQDAVELRSADVTARVELGTAGGTRHVTVSAGYGLALAAASGAPVRVAEAVLGRLGVPVRDDDLVTPFLPASAAGTLGRLPQRWRFEPRNLAFTDGLDRWQLFGDAEEPHRQDYSCAIEDQRVILSAAVPEPYGFAFFNQDIFADDYRGQTVTFRGELRGTDVADRAGLVLHVSRGTLAPRPAELDPRYDPRHDPRNHFAAVSGSNDWTRHEITAQIPGDAGIVSFGVFLTGPGQIEFRNAELETGAG